ncbi:LytR/AlgR family response regulator transcription factor [Bacteroidota bacterium]
MKKISAIIVDDEELARTRIRRLLNDEKDIEIVTECSNGLEAVKAINDFKPDLVFLDIQMPEMDGFEVMENLGPGDLPFIIFVTAYDKYAIKAFDVHAIDYLLKPFDDDRFFNSIDHAREKINIKGSDNFTDKILNILNNYKTDKPKFKERLLIKTEGRFYFVKASEIIRIKAAGKHIDIRTTEKSHLMRKTMNEIESQLNPDQFIRIHRSAIINIDQIKEIQYWYKNEYIFILNNDEKIASSSSYRKNLDGVLDR